MTPEELKESYSKLSTQELLEIIDKKFEYTELAVTVALSELANRQITEQEISTYKEDQIARAETSVRKYIFYGLSLLQKNLFYFLWVPFLNFGFKQNFRDSGFILKLKQANYYSLLGFIFFMCSVFLSIEYDFNEWTTIAFWILGFIPTYAFDETFNRRSLILRLRAKYSSQDESNESESLDEENGL